MSLQLPMSAPVDVVNDGRARMTYFPAFVAQDRADRWFASLHAGVPWRAERRTMYEREVAVPRLLAHYPLDAADLPCALQECAGLVAARLGTAFTDVGLNLYRDGRDSVAPHHDRTGALDPSAPIAIVSLGGTRTMLVGAIEPPRRTRRIALEHGSLLVMDFASQRHWLHGVPKTARPVEPRISLAFRRHLA